jgi:hypothetical protein
MGIIIGVLALALAGCGGTSGVAERYPTVAQPTATHHPIAGTSVRPCSGPYADVNSAGTPGLVLTQATPGQSGTAQVGELVQVQLPISMRWTYTASAGSPTPALNAAQDPQRSVCFWNFQMTTAGSITLNFTGTPLCDQPNMPCPQYARVVTFTVRVS